MEKKVLIKLKEGSYLDLFCKDQYIMSDRPYVAWNSNGIQALIARGAARWLGELKEKATQKDFDDCLKKAKGDDAKAINMFLKAFGTSFVKDEPKVEVKKAEKVEEKAEEKAEETVEVVTAESLM